MEAAGVTADQIDTSQPEVLIDAISKMYQESGGNPSVLGLDPQANGQAELWVLGMGGQLNDADGVPTLDDPSNIAGIELLKQVVDAQAVTPRSGRSPTPSTPSGRTTSSSPTRSAPR